MVQGVGYIKQLNNQALSLCSMLLEIEKTEKELLGIFGLQELMLPQENLVHRIQN